MTCTIVVGTSTITETGENMGKMTQKQRILITILALYRQGYTDFYVNCERGISLWAAEAICHLKKMLKIGLYIAIPFENQCMEWTENERNRYYEAHSKADEVQFVCRKFQPDCYQLADKKMLSRSDLLLVFGDEAAPCSTALCAAKAGIAVQYVPL